MLRTSETRHWPLNRQNASRDNSPLRLFAGPRMIFRLVPVLLFLAFAVMPAQAEPATVYFRSADGRTDLAAYLFKPTTPGPHPAIVLLHGRAGPYSANFNKDCTLVSRGQVSLCFAATLSKRHAMWGEFWAARGVVALLPDSFGPRGKAHGFGRFTHGDPDRDEVNEKTVRPLDAEGALVYLRGRPDVTTSRIFLQVWLFGGLLVLFVLFCLLAFVGFCVVL